MFTTSLLLVGVAAVTFALVAWFRDLEVNWSGTFIPAAVTGTAAAAAHFLLRDDASLTTWAVPSILVLGSILLRWRRVDEDWVDGMMCGLAAGAIAGAMMSASEGASAATVATAQGAIAGFSTHIVLFRLRLFGAIAGVVAAAVLAYSHVSLTQLATQLASRGAFYVIAAVVVLAIVATVIQLRRLLQEFEEESQLGVVTPELARELAHPLRRLTMSGWSDRKARQHFVRIARDLATRKSRQRRMDAPAARLYQLEIIKLRQLLQEIFSVELSVRESARATAAAREASDRMNAEKVTTTE